MQMEIAGTLEVNDLRRAFRWTRQLQDDEVRAAHPAALDRRLFGPFFMVVAIVLGFGGQPLAAIASGLIGIILLFPGLAYWPWLFHWQYVVLPAQYQEHRQLFDLRWRLDDLGLDLIDARPAEQRYNWTDYRAYAEDESGFLLYWWPEPGADPETFGDREQVVHFLPRRFFPTEDAAAFSEFLRFKFAAKESPV